MRIALPRLAIKFDVRIIFYFIFFPIASVFIHHGKAKNRRQPSFARPNGSTTKRVEQRPGSAKPRTGYQARMLGKEIYSAPDAMDNRDAHAAERSERNM